MNNPGDEINQTKGTGDIRTASEYGETTAEPYEPLTEDDIEDFDSMDLEHLDTDALAFLLDRVKDLQHDMEGREPEAGDSDAHDLWTDEMAQIEDFIDALRDRIDELKGQEN